jgi:hypothetical protein
MENAGIFYGHLEYYTVIGYILWPFGNVVVIRHIFPRFGLLCEEKSGNPVRMDLVMACAPAKSKTISNFPSWQKKVEYTLCLLDRVSIDFLKETKIYFYTEHSF